MFMTDQYIKIDDENVMRIYLYMNPVAPYNNSYDITVDEVRRLPWLAAEATQAYTSDQSSRVIIAIRHIIYLCVLCSALKIAQNMETAECKY